MERRMFVKGLVSLGLVSSVPVARSAVLASRLLGQQENGRLVVFAGGAGIQIAKCYSDLVYAGAIAAPASVRTLIIGECYCRRKLIDSPISDYQLFMSEIYAHKRHFTYDMRMAVATDEIDGARKYLRQGCSSVIIVAGLGSHTGTFACGAVARLARQEGIPIERRVLITPFDFEGERKRLSTEFIARTRIPGKDVILRNQDAYTEYFNSRTKVDMAMSFLNRRAAVSII